MKTKEIKTISLPPDVDLAEESPLYVRYSGQMQSQPAYIEVDLEEGLALFGISAEIGNAVPEAVFNGRVQRFSIPSDLLSDQVEDLQADKDLLNLLSELVATAKIDWRDGNLKLILSEAVENLIVKIEEKIYDIIE